MNKKKFVVDIYFGTSEDCYAYGFFNKINNIYNSNFSGQSITKKVPTEIILDSELEHVLAFGMECKKYISGFDKQKYEYFKHIKMNLYNKNYKIKSTNGKEVNIEFIIAKILEEVSKKALNKLKVKMILLLKKKI